MDDTLILLPGENEQYVDYAVPAGGAKPIEAGDGITVLAGRVVGLTGRDEGKLDDVDLPFGALTV